jgi:hypothetical protein
MGRGLLLALALLAGVPSAASAAFPWNGGGKVPNDLNGKEVWMYAATPEPGNEAVNRNPRELGGVRGARLVDADQSVPTAWKVTTGRPDVVIAVHDSGIKWNDTGAMKNLRRKTWLEAGELPAPRVDRTQSLDDEVRCDELTAGRDDADGDGAFTVTDFACDSRVERDPAARAGRGQPRGVGPADLLDPQDLLIAFSDGRDDDRDGFVDEIVGWDFLDDDNDPYDDVQYGHGTGEANDSVAEADNGQSGAGTCPDCMAMHIRVGDSFVADVNRFAQGVLFSVDNGALVVQEALGALNNSKLARDAVRYAYERGVVTIASAADEAAQHHHWPMSYPGVIVVNSVTKYNDTFTPQPRSYLQFNGCTNFSSKISVAIPSVSCSSDATGRASGMAGLLYSAARDAGYELTANEVRQLMEVHAEDVNWAASELSCRPVPAPGCTDPATNVTMGPFGVSLSPLVTTRRYPARAGHDQFYGHGRANLEPAVRAAKAKELPPSVELVAPEWFDQVDPADRAVPVRAEISARGQAYTCRVLVAPGSYPSDRTDFAPVDSDWCDGTTARDRAIGGESVLASIDVAELRAAFPATAGDFTGREPGIGEQTQAGRPNTEPYGFVVKVVATAAGRTGADRRNLYLHRDADLLPGWPKRIGGQVGGDVESSPAFADLDGDGADELVIAGSDGRVHAMRRDGTDLPGWPAEVDPLPLHRGQPAFREGHVDPEASRGAILASVAVGDLDRDGEPEVVVADLEGKVTAFRADGRRRWVREANPDFSGRPLSPFVDERREERHRVQHGFIASPVLADLDADGTQEVVAASMDRHVYAWHEDGRPVDGFPVIVVDPEKVAAIDPRSHRVTFKEGIPSLMQGAIIDTPAVGDLTGDGRPEIVVGTNEEYREPVNAAAINTTALNLIGRAGAGLADNNARVYAIKPTGGDLAKGEDPFLDGWPFKVGRLFAELLPIVGEGITGAPVIGPVDCPSGGPGAKVGVVPDGGPAYVLNPDGTSCLGEDPEGRSIAMQSDIPEGNPLRADVLTFPAVGHPMFADLGTGRMSLVTPTTGVLRALDLTVNDYQGGEDSYSAWNPATGRFEPGWPARVNDLSFLTGPSAADIDGLPGQEVLGGTAHLDLQAFDAAGKPASPAWPKLTSDWMVANPLVGDLGGTGERVVVSAVRDGRIFAHRTGADACAPASWPRFHHDDANSGDARRDAEPPSAPRDLRVEGGQVRVTPGRDDGPCGAAAQVEFLTSDAREPRGSDEGWSTAPPAPDAKWIAARSIDDQGNVSRPVTLRR